MARDHICGMAVDEKTGISCDYQGHKHYFCSQRCLKKFVKQYSLFIDQLSICQVQRAQVWYKNKTFVVSAVLLALVMFSFIFAPLEPFRYSFLMYMKKVWWAIVLGLLLGGLIDYYIPREYISALLARPQKRTIVYSVFLGFFMSACSHGILALAIQLYKKGASVPAVAAFLLASPWANMALTIMLIAFFGLKALFIIVSAIIIALISGFIFQFLEKNNLVERNTNSCEFDTSFSIGKDIKKRIKAYRFSWRGFGVDARGVVRGVFALGDMVMWWILVGMGIASFAGAYIPAHIFSSYMGPTIGGLLVTLLFATIIEICSEGSAPMAFEIFKQTGAFGNAFVFLMAGVVTDYTEIGLLWHNVGKRAALWLPVVTVPQVILVGIIANRIF